MSNLPSKIIYIAELGEIKIEETAIVSKIEGDKVYCRNEYGYDLVFNLKTGYCYTDHLTFGAKKYLPVSNTA
jgi:hypothetical protein